MRDLGAFLRAVARKLSTGVGVTLNIITAIGLVGSVTVWSTPILIWITVVILNIFGATFLAWRYEKTRADALVAELHEIKELTSKLLKKQPHTIIHTRFEEDGKFFKEFKR